MEQNPKIRIIHHSGQQRTIRLQLFNSWKLDSNGVTRYGWKTIDENTNEDIIKNFTADINAIAQTTAPIIQKKKDVASVEASDVNEVEMPSKSEIIVAIANGEPVTYGNSEKAHNEYFDALQKMENDTIGLIVENFEAEKKEAPKRKRPPVKRKKK